MSNSVELLKFLSSFVILIVMMGGLYYYLNRLKRGSFVNKGGDLRLLQMQPLGKNMFLCLIKAKDTTMLLACDTSGIRVLKEWQND